VHAQGNGYVVLVANGRDGMARRDPSGVWRRIGFGSPAGYDSPREPPRVDGLNVVSLLPYPLALGFVVAGLALPVAAAAGMIRRRRWRGYVPVGWVLTVLGAAASFGGASATDSLLPVLPLLLGLLLLIPGAIIATTAGVEMGLLTRGRIGWITLIGLGGGAGVLVPFIVWQSTGALTQVVALIIAVAAALLALAGSAALTTGERRPSPSAKQESVG
jgi:hypothetical protein